MDQVIEYIQQFGRLTQRQIELIKSKAASTHLRKDDYYLKAGKIMGQVGFIINDLIRVSYLDDQGVEITSDIMDKQHLIFPGKSIDEVYTASESFMAVTDTNLITFSIRDWKEMTQAIPGWNKIIQKIWHKYRSEEIARRNELLSKKGIKRFIDFLEAYPHLTAGIPLSFIASYLSIPPSSLRPMKNRPNKYYSANKTNLPLPGAP